MYIILYLNCPSVFLWFHVTLFVVVFQPEYCMWLYVLSLMPISYAYRLRPKMNFHCSGEQQQQKATTSFWHFNISCMNSSMLIYRWIPLLVRKAVKVYKQTKSMHHAWQRQQNSSSGERLSPPRPELQGEAKHIFPPLWTINILLWHCDMSCVKSISIPIRTHKNVTA